MYLFCNLFTKYLLNHLNDYQWWNDSVSMQSISPEDIRMKDILDVDITFHQNHACKSGDLLLYQDSVSSERAVTVLRWLKTKLGDLDLFPK